jgi:hypothetical protein
MLQIVLLTLEVLVFLFELSVRLLKTAVLALEGLVRALESGVLAFNSFHLFFERGIKLLFSSQGITDFEFISVLPAGIVGGSVGGGGYVSRRSLVTMAVAVFVFAFPVLAVVMTFTPSFEFNSVLPAGIVGGSVGGGGDISRGSLVTMAVAVFAFAVFAVFAVVITFTPSFE